VRGAQARSPATRRRHREAALARYFADARTVIVDLTRVALRAASGAPLTAQPLPAGTLVALEDAEGMTLALGAIETIDTVGRTVTVRTPVAGEAIGALIVGETTLTG
jgi:polynucleotide 5'-kinase involved in rRNA processing